MSQPLMIILLQDLLHEVRLIRRHLDPPVTAEERKAFLEAVTEQMADKPTLKGAKATVIEVDGLDPNCLKWAERVGVDPATRKRKPTKAAKKLHKDIQEKGKTSDEK